MSHEDISQRRRFVLPRRRQAARTRLLDAGGYRTEDECRNAVLILKNEAALAAMPGRA